MNAKRRGNFRVSSGPPDKDESERRQGERREAQSDGYAYITTVGWICRREQCRRNGDALFL